MHALPGLKSAIGDSVTPLIFLGVAAVLNIAANILFVAVFHWGIFGVALATVLVLVFPRTFTALFLSDATEELHGYVFQYLLWTAPYYPVLAVLVLFRNSLQGMGYPLVPFIGGVLELLARGGLSFLFLSWMGFRGACFTGPVAWFLAAALGMAYYYFHVMREPRGSVPRTDRSLRSRTSPSRR